MKDTTDTPLERLRSSGFLQLDCNQDLDENLGVRIYRSFREALLSGTLAVGDLLNTRPLAAELGVSTMPVREAMSRLVSDGGLEPLANRAFRVPEISTAQFRELYLMRSRLESLAAEHAAARANSDDLSEINETFDEMVRCEESGLLTYLAAHRTFHFRIYQAASMPLLFNVIETLWLRMGPILSAGGAGLVSFDEETDAHRDLLASLHRGDPGGAARAIDDDLRRATDRTTRFVAERERLHLGDNASAGAHDPMRKASPHRKKIRVT